MVQANITMLLVLFIIVGLALCTVYGAKASRVQFSLSTIFITITTSCVCLAFFATFGTVAFEMFGWILMVLLPPVHFVLVALLSVTVIHTRHEQQAVAIGRLVPLVGLAVSETIRVGGLFAAVHFGVWSATYFLICIVAYVTALASGYVCREAFRNLKKSPRSLAGLQKGLGAGDEIASGATRFEFDGRSIATNRTLEKVDE